MQAAECASVIERICKELRPAKATSSHRGQVPLVERGEHVSGTSRSFETMTAGKNLSERMQSPE